MPGITGFMAPLTKRTKYEMFETRSEYREKIGEPPSFDPAKKVKNWFIPADQLTGPLAPNSQGICVIPDVLAATSDGTPRLDPKTGKPYVEVVFMPVEEVTRVNIMETLTTETDPAKMKPDPKIIGYWQPPINPPGPDEEWAVLFGGIIDIVKKGSLVFSPVDQSGKPAGGGSVDLTPVMDELGNIKALVQLLLARA